jgi:hypothetical protein
MPSVNSFSKVDYVAMETLRLFMHKSEIFARCDHDHEEDFKKEFAVGDTIRVKYPWRPIDPGRLRLQPAEHRAAGNDDHRRSALRHRLRLGHDRQAPEHGARRREGQEGVPGAGGQVPRGGSRQARGAVRLPEHRNITGVLGTNPTTFDATSAACRQRFSELSSLSDDKAIFVPPAVMRAIKGGSDATCRASARSTTSSASTRRASSARRRLRVLRARCR